MSSRKRRFASPEPFIFPLLGLIVHPYSKLLFPSFALAGAAANLHGAELPGQLGGVGEWREMQHVRRLPHCARAVDELDVQVRVCFCVCWFHFRLTVLLGGVCSVVGLQRASRWVEALSIFFHRIGFEENYSNLMVVVKTLFFYIFFYPTLMKAAMHLFSGPWWALHFKRPQLRISLFEGRIGEESETQRIYSVFTRTSSALDPSWWASCNVQ
jgi:hypothetical protein